MNLFDLSGKTAVVTGGAGLIGESICKALDGYGASVVIADVDSEGGKSLSEELGDAVFVETDVTSEDSVVSMVDESVDRFGSIDVLVNSAYPRNENYGNRYEDVTADDWRENVNLHLNSYFVVTKHVSEKMVSQGSGSIINLASIYGVQAPDFNVYEGTDITSPVEYSAIKGGIINLTRYLASYLGRVGVRANAISPGGIKTDQDSVFVRNYEEKAPLGRMATPDDIKGAVVYLSSDASSYVTGHNLVVDGGWTIC